VLLSQAEFWKGMVAILNAFFSLSYAKRTAQLSLRSVFLKSYTMDSFSIIFALVLKIIALYTAKKVKIYEKKNKLLSTLGHVQRCQTNSVLFHLFSSRFACCLQYGRREVLF